MVHRVFPSKRLLALGPFHWDAVAPWRAGRVALGVVAPLVLGWASGHLEYGAFASLGALPAGFAAFQGVSRSRATAVVAASLGMAVSTFIGATVAGTPWLLLLVVIVYGYLAGLMVCVGPRMSVVVLQWAVGLLIAVGLPLPPAHAALRTALVLGGGLFQAALVAGTWALRPGDSERVVLAASYRALAHYAAEAAAGRLEAPPAIAFPAITNLADPNPLLPIAVRLMLLDLLEQAERIRASLAALAMGAASAHREDPEVVRHLASGVAGALDLIAGALDARRAERAVRIRDVSRRVAALTVAPDVARRWAGEALLGQLRAVAQILRRLDGAPRPEDTDGRAHDAGGQTALSQPDDGIAAALVTLRANLTPSTETGRHALRLAAVAGLAEMLVQATGLASGRWAVLTVFLVLKPDYVSTLTRGVHRAVGTALGAALGVAAVQLGQLGQGGLVVAAGISIVTAYAVFDASYLVFSVFITSFIVVLLEILGIAAFATAGARLVDTAIGAGLAIMAFMVWPTWGGLSACEKFGQLLDAHGEYTTALLRKLGQRSRADRARLRILQQAARRARGEAEASAVRLSQEPSHPPLTPDVAATIIAAVRRLAHAELALHALSAARGDGNPQDDATARRLEALAEAVGATLSQLALSLNTLERPRPLPALRPLQVGLRDEPGVDLTLVDVIDGLVDAIDTIEAILRKHLASPVSGGSARHPERHSPGRLGSRRLRRLGPPRHRRRQRHR